MQMAVVEYMEADLKEHSTTIEKDKSPITIASTKRRLTMEADLSGSSISNIDQEELLKSAKAKMGEVKEENERLKKLLADIVKQYQALEKQISTMARPKHSSETINSINEENQETDMVSLSLGSRSCNKKYDDDRKQASDSSNKRRKMDGGLELGLDCKFQHYPKASPTSGSMKNSTMDNECNEEKEVKIIETWPPSRDLKVKENTSSREGDEESMHQPQVKKTRVCIRSRSDSPTIHDGCQWRKYGQKIAKGNPCPRAYYRCTVSSNCPVRKQVQRCPHDMSILITTYEGTHNHPLPLAATAMASATSAAAAMIKTGSLTSQPTLNTTSAHNTTSSYGLHTSNLITTFNNNPSMISAASHNSHPTVTLDLTTANPDFSPFNWSSSSSTLSRNSSSFLNFSSSSSSSPSFDFSSTSTNPNWASGYLNYGTLFPYNNNNNNDNTRNIFQSLNSHQQSLNETIAAAATKAIASNPNFQSVLEAAISSYVGNKVNNNNEQKKSSSFPWNNSNSQSDGGGSLMLFPNSLPLSKSKSTSPGDTRDHIS